MSATTVNFSGVDWGPDEAKGDSKLLKYFVPFPDFSSVRSGDFRYIIGRKGAGKTAVIERIRLETQNDPLTFRSSLSLRDFPLHEFRDLRDKNYRDKSQFVSAWLLLLYVEIAKLIASDNGAQPRGLVDDLAAFLRINELMGNIGFTETISTLRKSEHKLKILAKWIEGESSSGSQVQSQASLHYKKVVDLLHDKIKDIQSPSQYWIFMDELDEGFRAGDANLRLVLLALLRAVEDSSIQLKSPYLTYRPLLVLRSDIFDRLEDNDLNKLDDHVLRLRWNSREDDDAHSLRKVVNARISTSLPGLKGELWERVTNDRDAKLPESVATVWSYVVNRTYERPRDIVKFLKYCQKKAPVGKLTFETVRIAEDAYSDWLYREIRDELHSYLPCWREALQCLTRVGSGKIRIDDYRTHLEGDRTIKKWLEDDQGSIEKITETLFDFGIIGNLDDKRRWLFKYKDDDLAWNPDMDLIVHFGLHKKLRLVR